MPLQNRVTPFGAIKALRGRGTLMGNRGILHDDARRVVRSSALKRWIACVLEFRGRKRAVMSPHRYTELFFLDEAAAFSAGHRPCAECRNADYKRFRALWERCFGRVAGADAIDERLHAERREGRAQRTHRAGIATLPDGTLCRTRRTRVARARRCVTRLVRRRIYGTPRAACERRRRGVDAALVRPCVCRRLPPGRAPERVMRR